MGKIQIIKICHGTFGTGQITTSFFCNVNDDLPPVIFIMYTVYKTQLDQYVYGLLSLLFWNYEVNSL